MSLQSCSTLCNHMDYTPPSSSVHGIISARILEWVAISSSRGSSQPKDQTSVSCIGRQVLYHGVIWEAQLIQIKWGAYSWKEQKFLWAEVTSRNKYECHHKLQEDISPSVPMLNPTWNSISVIITKAIIMFHTFRLKTMILIKSKSNHWWS